MLILFAETTTQTLHEPIAKFVLLLAIALVIPPIFERLRLPGLVGLLVAGVIFGGNGLGWLESGTETLRLLSDIGKIYLMFVAGLEIDLIQFQRTRNRALTFGYLTFAIPMAGGIAVGLLFNFGWLAAVLIGSLLASHTLLAYPIIQRLGVVRDEAVTITVGATIFTDMGSLLVLAICLGVNQGDFTITKLLTLLISLVLYSIAVLVGLKRFGHYFFRKTGQDEGNQFLFVLLSVFLCAVVAQLIGVESIIGAFLSGLAINSVVGNGPVKEKTEFLGAVLFIPMFFINMGLLLDLEAFEGILRSVELPLLIVGTLLATKTLAALGTKLLFRYNWPQFWTMASLSFPQVAATLAATVVGYEAKIINIQVFNSVILMMLVTSILGPVLTARYARELAARETLTVGASQEWLHPVDLISESFVVVVPIYNPQTERFLIELAAMLVGQKRGQIVPLAIAVTQPHLDSRQLDRAVSHCRRRLKAAEHINESFGAPMVPRLRIEGNVAQAICHVSREEDADFIVLGMGARSQLGIYLFNSVHEAVMRSAHCPVLVARLLDSPTTLKNLLLPIKNPTPDLLRVLQVAHLLATANQGRITLLHVYHSWTAESVRNQLQQQLAELVGLLPESTCDIDVQFKVNDQAWTTIAEEAQSYDCVILRSQPQQLDKGVSVGLGLSPMPHQLPHSVILVGDAHLHPYSSPHKT
jgi:Kef-type K+ transport system membrane component KefB/nucleotide-binding universal stress UspA family protein